MSKVASITKLAGIAGLAFATLTGAASAADREFSWSVTGTGTSDYIFRGLSLNNEDPALQASIDATYGIFYAGVWGSMLDNGAIYGNTELDFYAGIKPELGPVTFDFGVVYYAYFWGSPGDTNYTELKAGLSYSPVDKLTLKPVFWYVPDQDNAPEQYTIEGTAAYELPQMGIFTPTVSGLLGYTEATDVADFYTVTDGYTYWNAGVSLAVDKFVFDFRYWDTDLDQAAGLYSDERFVFTASITLP